MELNKKLWLKILIPLFITTAVVTIWIVKNHDPKTTIKNAESSAEIADENFELAVTEAVDFDQLKEYGIPIIVDYGADSCGPCLEMAPTLEKLNSELLGEAFIKFADVFKYAETAENVPLQVIPSQILFNADGTPFVPSDELASETDFIMYSDKENGKHIFTVHQGILTEEQFRSILSEMEVE